MPRCMIPRVDKYLALEDTDISELLKICQESKRYIEDRCRLPLKKQWHRLEDA